MKIAYWVFCASKHNRKFQILTFGEIHTIRFSNFNRIRIRILFGFGKSGEYEYEYIRFWKIIRIRIRILFGLKISAEYEYEYHYSVSTIRILFEYRIIRSPLCAHLVLYFTMCICQQFSCPKFMSKVLLHLKTQTIFVHL